MISCIGYVSQHCTICSVRQFRCQWKDVPCLLQQRILHSGANGNAMVLSEASYCIIVATTLLELSSKKASRKKPRAATDFLLPAYGPVHIFCWKCFWLHTAFFLSMPRLLIGAQEYLVELQTSRVFSWWANGSLRLGAWAHGCFECGPFG